MVSVETRTRNIVARLKRDGWVVENGKEHDIFRHPAFAGVRIVVPRHRELSNGVARSIAMLAKW
jgi:predicted RNA binding protein YcfA (HicA-like mRNA interferase family)